MTETNELVQARGQQMPLASTASEVRSVSLPAPCLRHQRPCLLPPHPLPCLLLHHPLPCRWHFHSRLSQYRHFGPSNFALGLSSQHSPAQAREGSSGSRVESVSKEAALLLKPHPQRPHPCACRPRCLAKTFERTPMQIAWVMRRLGPRQVHCGYCETLLCLRLFPHPAPTLRPRIEV